MRFQLILIAVFITLIPGSPSWSKPNASGSIKCWYFEQHNKFVGPYQIYACARGVRIIAQKNKWHDIAKAPAWDLYFFNPSSHAYCTYDLKSWRGNHLMGIVSSIPKEAKLLQTNDSEKICGLTCPKFTVEGKNAVRGQIDKNDIWLNSSFALPPQVITVVSGNCGLPKLPAFPMKVYSYLHETAGKVALITTVVKQTTVPADFFDLPPGSKQLDSGEEVLFGGLNGIFSDIIKNENKRL